MKYVKNILTVVILVIAVNLMGCTSDAPSDLPKAGLGGVTIINMYQSAIVLPQVINRAVCINPLSCIVIQILLQNN